MRLSRLLSEQFPDGIRPLAIEPFGPDQLRGTGAAGAILLAKGLPTDNAAQSWWAALFRLSRRSSCDQLSAFKQ